MISLSFWKKIGACLIAMPSDLSRLVTHPDTTTRKQEAAPDTSAPNLFGPSWDSGCPSADRALILIEGEWFFAL
jgi:hypothetical protein